MSKHDCGCITHWDTELNHPVYDKACGVHRGWAELWMVADIPTQRVLRPRESV